MEEQTVTTMLTPDAAAESSSAPGADSPPDAPATTGDAGSPDAPHTPKNQGAGPSGVERRIQQLVARQHEAERREAARAEEAAYWRGIAEGRIKPAAPDTPQSSGAPRFPSPADFERSEDYEEARTRYVVEKAKWDLKQEMEAHRARETQDGIERRYRARMDSAASADPEILEIENDTTLPVSLPMALAIKESEAAPSILRYLSAHRDEALRISRLSPIAAAREIGRIEAGTTASPGSARTVSQAPEPVKPVGGTKGSIETDLDKLPIEEFVKRRNEAKYGKK